MKTKRVKITAEVLRKTIEDGKHTSMTQLAHSLGYKGNVSSSLTRKFRELVPDIDALMAANKRGDGCADGGKPTLKSTGAKRKPAKAEGADKTAQPHKGKVPKNIITAIPEDATGPNPDRWPRDPRNPFREGSAYGVCFDILAQHPQGMPRPKLVELLAAATGKPPQHAAYDAQVVLSARGNDEGLNPFEGPRNRSCRFGFWVKRDNSHVRLVLPSASKAKRESP